MCETDHAASDERSTTRRAVFVSYADEDLAWAQWVGSILEANGYSVTLAKWDFRPGSNFVVEMNSALRKCAQVVALLSPAYLYSQYAQSEWAAAFAQDPTGKVRRLIPVRVEDCVLEGLLPQIVHADLTGRDEAGATEELLAAVSGERRKPKSPIQFPGQLPDKRDTEGSEAESQVEEEYPGNAEEEGFLDLVIRGTEAIEEGTEAAGRFTEEIGLLRQRVSLRAGELDGLRKARSTGPRDLRNVARSTANDMSLFADRAEPELRLMATRWETGLAAWRRAISLFPALGPVDESVVAEHLAAIDSIIAATPSAKTGVERMLDSTRHLQPLEGSFIAARNRVASLLEAAVRALERTAGLAAEARGSALEVLSAAHREAAP